MEIVRVAQDGHAHTVTIADVRGVGRNARALVAYEKFHYPPRGDEWVRTRALERWPGARGTASTRGRRAGGVGREEEVVVAADADGRTRTGGRTADARTRDSARGSSGRARGGTLERGGGSGDGAARSKARSKVGEATRGARAGATRTAATRARGDDAKKPRRDVSGGNEVDEMVRVASSVVVPIAEALSREEREERTVRVNASAPLRRALLRDYENSRGTDPREFVRPRVTVANIFRMFLEERARGGDAKGKTPSKASVESSEKICEGLEASFNAILHEALLYKDEWHYSRTTRPSEVYGVVHLLRMLVKLPQIFPPESFANAKSALAVQTKTNELLRFINARAEELGLVLAEESPADAPSTPDNADAPVTR